MGIHHKATWGLKLSAKLKGFLKPKFISSQEVRALLNQVKREDYGSHKVAQVNNDLYYEILNGLKDSKILIEVSRGVYANMMATPAPSASDVAQLWLPESVVSLHTVLGDSGVLNNPSDVAMNIIPMKKEDWSKSLRNIRKIPHFGEFRFFYMPDELVNLTGRKIKEDYIFNPLIHKKTATNEKALADWIYLSRNNRSKLGKPPSDIDLNSLKMKRLLLICEAMGTINELNAFILKVNQYQSKEGFKYNGISMSR